MKPLHKKLVIAFLLILFILYWFGFRDEFILTSCVQYSEGWESVTCFLSFLVINLLNNSYMILCLFIGIIYVVGILFDRYQKYRIINKISGITKFDMLIVAIFSGIISILFYKWGIWIELWKMFVNFVLYIFAILLITILEGLCSGYWPILKEKFFHKK